MSILAKFAEGARLPNPWMDRWKAGQRKILGYFCSYVPEELISAAGLLPVRVRAPGCTDSPIGDAYMSSTTCGFTRAVLELASRKEYPFLDGIVGYNSCDQVRRLFDNLRFKSPFPYNYFLSVPATFNEVTLEWFQHELQKFKNDLKKNFSADLSDENIQQAIKLHNETRNLLRRLHELRKKKSPPVTGSEMMEVALSAVTMPKSEFNVLLPVFLKDAENGEGNKEYKARIMVVGSLLDDPGYMNLIEDLGGIVVTDSLCFGTRYFVDPVDEKTDPFEALARRYLSKVSCPRMATGHAERMKFIKDQIDQFQVDGVVIQRMKFCPLWWGESYMLIQDLKKEGIPCLELEKEYVTSGIGAMKTRIQAFLETLEGR